MTSAITSMPPILKRLPVRVVILGFLLITGVFAVALYQAFAAERQVRERAAKTTQIVLALQQALQTGVDAETGQRGFLLTADPRYLETYEVARAEWLGQLGAIVETFPPHQESQRAQALEMIRLAQAKLVELEQTIALVQAGDLTGAISVVQSGEGTEIFDAFRAQSEALAAQERAILAAQVAQTERIERRTFVMLGMLTAMGIVLTTLSLWLERRTTRAEHGARDAAALRAAYQRSDLLVREMDHRIKNLFTIVGAMISHSGRTETDLKPALATLRGRINALSVAHSVSQGSLERRSADLRHVVEATLAPFRTAEHSVEIAGDALALPVGLVSSLGLIFYELATNSSKYGALSGPGGNISISWAAQDGTVTLVWRERGGTPPSSEAPQTDVPPAKPMTSTGFGSVMLQQAAMQIDGTLTRNAAPGGLDVTLRFRPGGDGGA